MPATAVLEKKSAGYPRIIHHQELGTTNEATYFREYRHREDGFKYELVDGRIVKFRKTMSDAQARIAHNLTKLFFTLLIQGKVQGTWQTEKDTHLRPKHVRVPDMCYLSELQLGEADAGGHPTGEFMIEVVSPTDKAEKYEDKRKDYFAAGVKVLWLIYPNAKAVHVYYDAIHSVVCSGDMICSAAPVLPEFEIAAKDIFAKPDLPK